MIKYLGKIISSQEFLSKFHLYPDLLSLLVITQRAMIQIAFPKDPNPRNTILNQTPHKREEMRGIDVLVEASFHEISFLDLSQLLLLYLQL